MTKDKSPLDEKIETLSGQKIYFGNFSLKGTLGEGGAGRVFLAFDKNLRREVAIKELNVEKEGLDKEKTRIRFMREAKVTGQLEHPGVVPVYELGYKPDGTPFYVMKYVQGKTFFDAIRDCPGDTKEERFRKRLALLDEMIDICEAVGYAHSRGVIHRDLKPSNIILGDFGETVILDWGLAKVLKEEQDIPTPNEVRLPPVDDDTDAGITKHGALLGTPSYMAPEQIDPKRGSVDPSSDVYALGCILYMILTGEKPYLGKAINTLKLIASDMPSPRAHGKFIPPELVAICEKAMAKNKSERFQNASEMAQELKAYRDGRLVSVYAYTKKELFKRFIARNKITISAAAMVILSIIVGSAFALHFAVDAHRARLRAERTLIDVTKLSESAMTLARESAENLDKYFNKLGVQMSGDETLEQLSKSHGEINAFMLMSPAGKITETYPGDFMTDHTIPDAVLKELEGNLKKNKIVISDVFKGNDDRYNFFIQVPRGKKTKAHDATLALIQIDKAFPSALAFDPLKSPYQVWCMLDDGYILYDEDPKQIGLHLFTDAMYAKFPELLEFGEHVIKDTTGIGYYSFTTRDDTNVIYKIGAWETYTPIENITMKIVVTYPYIAKEVEIKDLLVSH